MTDTEKLQIIIKKIDELNTALADFSGSLARLTRPNIPAESSVSKWLAARSKPDDSAAFERAVVYAKYKSDCIDAGISAASPQKFYLGVQQFGGKFYRTHSNKGIRGLYFYI